MTDGPAAMTWRDVEVAIEDQLPLWKVLGFGGICPVQGWGDLPDGRAWYFRYRHDEATLEVFHRDPDDDLYVARSREDITHYSEKIDALGVPDGGNLTPEEAVDLFLELWRGLKPVDMWPSTGSDRLASAVDFWTKVYAAADEQQQDQQNEEQQ